MNHDDVPNEFTMNRSKSKEAPSAWEKIKSFFFIVFVLSIIIFTSFTVGNNLQLRLMGNRTIGHVIQVNRASCGVTLTVQYEVNGQVFTERVQGSGFTRMPQQNEAIPLFYSPRNPSRVTSMRNIYPLAIIWLILVIIMTLCLINALIKKITQNLR